MALSERARELLTGTNFAHLATLMEDGSPQVTPVWVDTDGEDVLVNTAEGRIKWRNVRRDPRVALDVTDSRNPYAALVIRGRVVEMTSEGAREHIDKLARRYTGSERYEYGPPDERRVMLRIRPERVMEAF
jgi:PPOX class probable F420-dependent enzyme